MQEKNDLLAEYGVSVEQLNFDIDHMSIEELKDALEAYKAAEQSEGEPAAEEPVVEVPVEETPAEQFALAEQFRCELIEALEQEKVDSPWGEYARYWYLDYDPELNEVYCEDSQDYKIYGFKYSVNGDAITIDFESKTRKKFAFVDFDEGNQGQVFASIFEKVTEEYTSLSDKYAKATEDMARLESEVSELSEFKHSVESAKEAEARNEIFEMFEDLIGIEAFESLRDNSAGFSVEELEDKCYAIRGRYKVQSNFSYNPQKSAKIKISNSEKQSEPYGGVISRYKGRAD